MDASQSAGKPQLAESIERLRACHSASYELGHASAWSVWETFCDHHGLDPENPGDADIVAFIHARALAGLSYSDLSSALGTLRLGIEGTPSLRDAGTLTIAAQRHLADLHYSGWFTATAQAPLLTVGQVTAMVERAETAQDALVVATTYLSNLI